MRLFVVLMAVLAAVPAVAQPHLRSANAPDLPSDSLLARADRLGRALLDGRDATLVALLDSATAQQVTPAMLAQARAGIAQRLGPLRQRYPVRLGVGIAETRQQLRFEHALLDLRVTFAGTGGIDGFTLVPPAADGSLPAYADTLAVRTASIRVAGLPGMLSMPKTASAAHPVPAVVLVHGSGPSDADELIGGTRVFRDLAAGLSAQGIAVVRYIKRTALDPSSFRSGAFTVKQEVTDDVLAALRLLRQTPGVDTTRIYVVGHSLGAMLAPRIAQQDGRLAGIALLAPPARNLQTLIRDQLAYTARTDTSTDARQLRQIMLGQLDALDAAMPSGPDTQMILGSPLAYWRDLNTYDPVATARSFSGRVLVLQGERDYQVSATRDFPLWQRGLSGKANATLRLLPRLNHLMVAGTGPSTPDEYATPAFVDAEAVSVLAAWINGASMRPSTPSRPARPNRRGSRRQ